MEIQKPVTQQYVSASEQQNNPITLEKALNEYIIYNKKSTASQTSQDSQVKTEITSGRIYDIAKNYDICLFDAYGVFWNGSTPIQATLDDMEALVKTGKQVIVVSNTTGVVKDEKEKYEKERKTQQNVHYTDFITSGEVFRKCVENGKIQHYLGKDNEEVKIYVHGKPNPSLFEGKNGKKFFKIVNSLEEADAVYLSVPQYTEKELEALPSESKHSEDLKKSKNGRYDSVNLETFKPFLQKCKEKKIKLLNANPDRFAPEKDYASKNGEINQVIRNGSLTQYYKELGEEFFECGKPSLAIYELVVGKLLSRITVLDENNQKLETYDTRLNKAKELYGRIVMIGDTPETDVAGANNAKIDSILLIGTGNTVTSLKNVKSQKEFNKKLDKIIEEFAPTYIINNISK